MEQIKRKIEEKKEKKKKKKEKSKKGGGESKFDKIKKRAKLDLLQ